MLEFDDVRITGQKDISLMEDVLYDSGEITSPTN